MQEELRHYSDKLLADGRAPLEIRVGANTGEVVVRSISTGGKTEYTPIGHTANLASRMQAFAPTGSIAISESTRKLVEGYFALKARGPTRVKGIAEPVNVYEVVGLGPLRTRLQRSAGRGLTKFVGRDREMEAMHNAAELARGGRGQIVAAMAEAGTGKSRLFFEFKAKNQSGWMVLEAFSVSYGKASAYLPVLDLLHTYFKITSDDDARSRREKVTGRVLALDRSLEDALPYLFALLGIVDGEDPLAQMDAQVKKRRTLDAIKRIVLRESLNQPLMLIFEDLHWIDEQTQEFLNLLADAIANARILLLVNYRPEYSHQWGSRTCYTQLRLDPLGKESADEMLSALIGDNPALVALKQTIIERTEGNPFFMEETVQVLLDEGALTRDGATVRLTKPIAELKIPPTVQGILAARIDRLLAEAKDLLQTLSVIGREFRLSLIRAVVRKPEEDLDRMLNDLQLGEFIYEQPAVGDTEYVFKHALTQEVSYNSVLQERRRQMHASIGAAIESLWAESLNDHLAELAHHFSRAAQIDKATNYLMLAGRQALARYAYAEAATLLREGLHLIDKLPELPERDARELRLASSLVDATWRIDVDSVETREAVERAASLAEKMGDLGELSKQLNRRRVTIARTGDFASAAVLAQKLLELAQRDGSALSYSNAYHATLQERLYNGDLTGAEEQFALWRKYQDAAGPGLIREGSVIVIGSAAMCALLMGRADLARDRMAEATACAQALNDPFALRMANWLEALLYRLLRDPERALTAASRSIALSYGSDTTSALGIFQVKASALAQLGRHAEALALLEEHRATARAFASLYGTAAKAEVLAMAGMYDAAMNLADQLLMPGKCDATLRSELLRVRGDIRIALSERDAAEADFREAIEFSRAIGAKMLELRATTSLARLLRDTGRREAARAMLAEIYGWFTEGFDTADLKDAKALLDELKS
jgi:predicted ATPase